MLRTRPPRSTPEEARARLACIRHAASVDPEPGSNSPPMTPKCQSTPKRHDAEASGLVAEPHDSEESAPVSSAIPRRRAGAACDGHALHWLTCCCWASRIDPGPRRPESPPRTSTIRSLRLRHTTPWPTSPSSQKSPVLAVRCASLSMCGPAFRSPQSLPNPRQTVKCDNRGIFPAPLPPRYQNHLAAQGALAASVRLSRNSIRLPPEEQYVKWVSRDPKRREPYRPSQSKRQDDNSIK